jgi:glutathione S-transferase
MSLTLYSHPLASFCHKVLIALYENGTPFHAETVDLGNPGSAAAHMERWPVGKMPVLHDSTAGRTIPETSIIIEYLQEAYAGPLRLLPDEPDARLETRLWDRFFDLYVNVPMAKIVTDRIRPEGQSDPFGVDEARATLTTAYAMIEKRMAGRDWVVSDDFTLADCAAAPAHSRRRRGKALFQVFPLSRQDAGTLSHGSMTPFTASKSARAVVRSIRRRTRGGSGPLCIFRIVSPTATSAKVTRWARRI